MLLPRFDLRVVKSIALVVPVVCLRVRSQGLAAVPGR